MRTSPETETLADKIVSEMHSVLKTSWDRECLREKIIAAFAKPGYAPTPGLWRPVETVPERSETPMLLYFPPIVVGAYKQSKMSAMYRTGHPADFPHRQPSHFMLLDPPQGPDTSPDRTIK